MNMTEAAARLGKIIKRLGGGTSTTDEAELKGLHADMVKASGAEDRPARHKLAPLKAQSGPAEESTGKRTPAKAPAAETVAKAKPSTGKKAKGK